LKIDYAKGYLNISGVNISFHQKSIITPSRLESLFCENRKSREMIKIGYVPKLKIAHEIYLGDTIVENVSGNAYLKVISMLDEEVEIEVPTFHLP